MDDRSKTHSVRQRHQTNNRVNRSQKLNKSLSPSQTPLRHKRTVISTKFRQTMQRTLAQPPRPKNPLITLNHPIRGPALRVS